MSITQGPANGTLLIHGGHSISPEFSDLFVEAAGGREARLVYIPTAFTDDELNGTFQYQTDAVWAACRFGFNGPATIMHTRDRNEADTETFARPLRDASAVFFTGGRQWRLADAYLNTRVHQELLNLLERGGVVAGSSAGASIQGSFLIRGNSDPDDVKIVIGDHREGLGLLQNAAIDQHLKQRQRDSDIAQVLEHHPDLLGIGLDEETFVRVQRDEFTVYGKGRVLVSVNGLPQQVLQARARYELALRKVT